MNETITLDRVNEGIAEFRALDDDSVAPLKEDALTFLADLLGEDIPDRPLRKAERLELLIRARQEMTA